MYIYIYVYIHTHAYYTCTPCSPILPHPPLSSPARGYPMCMYVCMYVCICMYIYIYIHIHMCIHIYIYIYIYVYPPRPPLPSPPRSSGLAEGGSQLRAALRDDLPARHLALAELLVRVGVVHLRARSALVVSELTWYRVVSTYRFNTRLSFCICICLPFLHSPRIHIQSRTLYNIDLFPLGLGARAQPPEGAKRLAVALWAMAVSHAAVEPCEFKSASDNHPKARPTLAMSRLGFITPLGLKPEGIQIGTGSRSKPKTQSVPQL